MPENSKIDLIRHSAAHVLAMAVLKKWPHAKLGIGPAVENGFYYDFDLPEAITPEDLPRLEKIMREIIEADQEFAREEVSADSATKLFNELGQDYKVELIDELSQANEPISIYRTGDFVDLCAGPHVHSAAEIDPTALKLTKIAGAYWKGDENNKMLTRIYGVAFATEEELQSYLKMLDEAKKRDHRILGEKLGLFVFSELVGPGLPLYTFKGAAVLKEIRGYSNELQSAIGYQEVQTPNMNRAELFKVSGHYEKYKDGMFKVCSHFSKEDYYLKPMNCPQHTQIYASRPRSYKDLPIRMADFAQLYRDEKTGELSGLTRLRGFAQDDGHSFCREDQIKDEFKAVLSVIERAMKTYGMNYKIRLSLWDPSQPEKYLGDAETWEKSQEMLEAILVEHKIDYFKAVGEAAIYGPKMDLISKDSLGREWQLSTIQLDLIMPQRFGLKYTDADGQEKTPVMIHRAIVGSPERFLGILIEHYAGAFPAWLAPVQVAVIPVSEKFLSYANEIIDSLKQIGLRVDLMGANETLGKKIRGAETQKVPYILVIGQKEADAGGVAVRNRGKGDEGLVKLEEFSERIQKEIKEKA